MRTTVAAARSKRVRAQRQRHGALRTIQAAMRAAVSWPRTVAKQAFAWTAAVLACVVTIRIAAAITLAGFALPATVSVGGKALVPLSCGVRDTLWIDHYAAVLYVPRGAGIDAVQDPAQQKAVLFRIIEPRYMPEQIPGKWLSTLEREVAARPLARARRAYRALTDGDRVLLEYVPRRGVTMRVNGKRITHLGGQGVVDALLEAWADGDAVRQKLDALGTEHPCRDAAN